MIGDWALSNDVKINYYSYTHGNQDRIIHPLDMFLYNNGWGCAAYCEKKNDNTWNILKHTDNSNLISTFKQNIKEIETKYKADVFAEIKITKPNILTTFSSINPVVNVVLVLLGKLIAIVFLYKILSFIHLPLIISDVLNLFAF